jgi:hypothetical protein
MSKYHSVNVPPHDNERKITLRDVENDEVGYFFLPSDCHYCVEDEQGIKVCFTKTRSESERMANVLRFFDTYFPIIDEAFKVAKEIKDALEDKQP